MNPSDTAAEYTTELTGPPCPASIWLLGEGVPCSKPEWHDGNHAVTIEWRVK